MKRLSYLLIASLLLLALLIIPYFQNIAMNPPVQFFFLNKSFTSVYFLILTLGMIEGVLIYLTIKEFVNQAFEDKKPKQFDL